MKTIYIVASVLVALYLVSLTMESCGAAPKSSDEVLTLYHSHQCGHCVKLMPTWLDMKRKAIDNNLNVKLREVEASSGKIPDGVTGFPTCEYRGKYYVGGPEITKLLNEVLGSNTSSKYTLYYADWCGYSKKILPIWNNKTQGNSNFTKIEESSIPRELASQIDGYPTMFVDGGKSKVVGYDKIKEFLEGL